MTFPVHRRRSTTVSQSFPSRFGILAFIAASSLFAFGCNDDADTDSAENGANARPFQGVTVRVAVPRDLNWAERWKTTLDEWSARTGAQYEFLEYELSADGASPSLPEGDLALFPISQLAAWRRNDRLAVMPEDLQDQLAFNWLDVLPGLRNTLTRESAKPIAVPIASPVLVCYYRRDLLDQAGLSPPETWEDYEKLVRFRDRWASGLTIAEPWHPNWRATMFFARAAASVKHPGYFGIQFDIESGKPLIDGEGYQKVLEDVVAGLEHRPSKVLQYTPDDCRRAVLNGTAAIAIGMETSANTLPWPWGVSTAGESRAENVRAENVQIGIQRLPGSTKVYNMGLGDWEALPDNRVNYATVTSFCGVAAGVLQSSDPAVQQAAWNLLELMTLGGSDMFFPKGERTICRESDTLNAAAWTGDDLSGEEQNEFVRSVRESLNDQQVFAEIPVVNGTAYRDALTAGLTAALTKHQSPAEALAEVAKKWSELVKSAGAETVRDSYRASLGLSKIGR